MDLFMHGLIDGLISMDSSCVDEWTLQKHHQPESFQITQISRRESVMKKSEKRTS